MKPIILLINHLSSLAHKISFVIYLHYVTNFHFSPPQYYFIYREYDRNHLYKTKISKNFQIAFNIKM